MITKALSKTISDAAIRAAKSAQHAVLFKRLIDTSTALYIAAFGSISMDLMNSLPEGWNERRSDFGVQFGGQRRTLFFTSTFGSLIPPFISITYGKPMRMPDVHISGRMDDAPNDLKQAFAEASDEYFQFKGEIAKLRERTEATIRGFTNLKVLKEQWPEMAPYIPADVPEIRPAGRALFNPVALNAAIGLPPT